VPSEAVEGVDPRVVCHRRDGIGRCRRGPGGVGGTLSA
jgi:hypothetical protein